MLSMRYIFLALIGCAASRADSTPYLFHQDTSVTPYEKFLIAHVKQAITRVEQGYRLPQEALAIPGMSSSKGRSFLNLLCTMPQTYYLEIGVFRGATFISALLGNQNTVQDAIAIDTFVNGDLKAEFLERLNYFLPSTTYHTRIFAQDCFQVDLDTTFTKPVNIYFYDGDHSAQSQKLAFTYFNSILADSFIAIVDDWDWPEVRQGTWAAFKKLGYQILFEYDLPATPMGTREHEWWNGMYVAVIRKNSQK